ncbi:hypothetical protein DCAR_0309950 [Daucus carota subsp. sativus]|uniref:NB-ARC domain-containing protein n=1 Tax=Daucus carota subsp. sativus TaxID=79200 RepID=A0A165ZHT1_DAUCS|nr:PREDICTED: putative disease resistance protein RGA4 [Daucus carota subsp. sativus]WOG90706.1 hypothetical protein DCAR_0309950 [Daucus carota subsp. sativus]
MADAFVTDLASGLVFKHVSLAAEELIQAWNLQENLVMLQERLEEIDALLSDAHSKRLNMSTVQSWFNKLQAVARVADAFMDQLAYEVTRRQVENRSTLRDFFSTKNSILYRFKVAYKIKSINSSFDKIFEWAIKLGLQPVAQLTTAVQPREMRNTPPFEDESLIVGRDDEISFLVETVCTNYAEDLPVIAVWGMGGQGKTTLARMVYNRDVVTDMFKKRMWVTVSDDFDFIKILNQMVSSLTSTASMLENPEGLIKKLQNSLRGVKFLLVLDDVWNERPEEWDNLKNSLLGVGGAGGSKILVTTRKQKVVDVMSCFITHRVEKLSKENSWELFKRRAFSRGVLETARYEAMGRRMVERCGGLPLAIKALGGLLHSKRSEQEWFRIQESATWDSNDDVLPSLRLSYDNLPHSSLKKCFAYCSILPKDSIIWKDEMVRLWTALGFLLPPKGSNKLMEDIGSEYFNILLWNCLLQDGGRDSNGDFCYKMHDLVHDLALDLSEHHSVTVKADHELNYISKAIYVRADEGISNIKPPILKRNFEKVQVLYANARIVRDLVPYPSHLIGLVLERSNELDRLPSSLSNLKYLKYLDISRCFTRNKLPDYISRLYNLQTLSVRSATQLPRKICNLINLRHILVAYEVELVSSDMFAKIERLTCLQTLPRFVVSRDHQCHVGQLGSLKNLRGTLQLYGLGDVENMEEARKASLHTKSNIEHLTLVWRKDEDVMEEKEYNDEDVMEGLEPHANLKALDVGNFMGKKFAAWITFMTNLEVITFKNCKRCEEFPQLGHLSKLRSIYISGMDNVKFISSHLCGGQGSIRSELDENGAEETVATMYPSLKNLYLWDMPKLEEWVDPSMDTSGEDPHNVLAFPKLEMLVIQRCSKLTRIPSSCFPLMKTLHITDLDSSKLLESLSGKACGLTCLDLDNIGGGVGCSSSSSLPCSSMNCIMGELLKNNSVSLETLSVRRLQGLTYLTLGEGLKSLSVSDLPDLNTINVVKGSDALKHLSISWCPNYEVLAQNVNSTIETLELGDFWEDLDEFPWPSSFSFPNVINLRVRGWEKLKWIVDQGRPDNYLTSIFPALRQLDIINFQGVKSLPISLAQLPFLERLSIWSCGNLESLPKFHDNFQFLDIFGCPVI